MSVGKHFSPKRLIGFFWNSTWSWSDLKVKYWQSQIFSRKPHFGDNNQKYPKNRVLWILLSHRCVNIFGLKDAPYWPLWFCKNHMSGKNMVLKLYAKKLLTNQIAGYLLTRRWLYVFKLQQRYCFVWY